MRYLSLSIVIISLAASGANGAETVDFPMFGYSPQRTSLVPGKGMTQPVLQWSYQVPGSRVGGRNAGAGVCMVGPDAVFVTAVPAAVIKLDRATGKELARFELGSDAIVHRATSLTAGKVLVLMQGKDRKAANGSLVCLDGSNLNAKWK